MRKNAMRVVGMPQQTLTLELTPEEHRLLLNMLGKVNVQGVEAMQLVLSIHGKLNAMTGPQVEENGQEPSGG